MPSVSKAMQQMMAIGTGKKKLPSLQKYKKSNAIRSLMDGDAEVAKKIAKGGK